MSVIELWYEDCLFAHAIMIMNYYGRLTTKVFLCINKQPMVIRMDCVFIQHILLCNLSCIPWITSISNSTLMINEKRSVRYWFLLLCVLQDMLKMLWVSFTLTTTIMIMMRWPWRIEGAWYFMCILMFFSCRVRHLSVYGKNYL